MTSLPKIKFALMWLNLFVLLISRIVSGSGSSVYESKHHKVLILGGGVTGVIAARTLHQNGIDDFLIVDALDELGGRMMSHNFAGKTIELGANWIQGTQSGDGPANPIFELARKHNITTQFNDWFGSISTCGIFFFFSSSSTGSLNLARRDLCCSYL